MILLKPVGFFKEDYPNITAKSIREVLTPKKLEYDSSALAHYLSALPWCAVVELQHAYDQLDPERPRVPMDKAITTDGEYVWPAVMAYYVGRYDLQMDLEFIRHVQTRRYRVPDDSEIGQEVAARLEFTLESIWLPVRF